MTLFPYRAKEFTEIFGSGFDIQNVKHTEYLKLSISKYDTGLVDTLSNGEVDSEYCRQFEFLRDFAIQYPSVDYIKFLNKEQSNQLSYFYSSKLINNQKIAKKKYNQIMNHYDAR